MDSIILLLLSSIFQCTIKKTGPPCVKVQETSMYFHRFDVPLDLYPMCQWLRAHPDWTHWLVRATRRWPCRTWTRPRADTTCTFQNVGSRTWGPWPCPPCIRCRWHSIFFWQTSLSFEKLGQNDTGFVCTLHQLSTPTSTCELTCYTGFRKVWALTYNSKKKHL